MMQQNSSSQINNYRAYFGSSIFFLYILISVPIFGSIILLCTIFPFSVRYNLSNFWVVTVLWMVKVCCGLTHQVEGLENLPKDQTYIVLSKHQSAWETMVFYLLCDKPVFVLKKVLINIPVFGLYLRRVNAIGLDRSKGTSALKKLIQDAKAMVDEERQIIIFPEGTRVKAGEKGKYQVGIAAVYANAKIPVVPMALNSGLLWPKNSFTKKPGTITVEFLPAIPPGLDKREFMRTLEEKIEGATNRLVG